MYRPTLTGTVTTTTSSTRSAGSTTRSRSRGHSPVFGASLSYPVLAAARWAQRAQAEDQIRVARLGTDETRRQVALATAQAYLAVIAQQRQVEVNRLARENATAHVEYARALLKEGAGSRLNELRAAQELAVDEVLLEASLLALRRAQEALGVLLAADAPVDAAAEPAFEIVRVAGRSELAGRTHRHQVVHGAHRRRAARLSATAGATGCRRRRSDSSRSW